MMQIQGRMITRHGNADCVASALAPDNLRSMTTTADGDQVITAIEGTQLRSVIASVDDYLMNLAIAEDACSSFSQNSADQSRNSDRKTPVQMLREKDGR
jgi:predicted O-linked N-acetylglucosamine transferase (SPINDLY family)